MNQKIRDAQLEKIPYMLVVGNKEAESGTVSVRLRTGEQLPSLSLDEFKSKIKQVIVERVNELKL
jgi:threonyl-tRNA synthetase